MQSHLAGNHVFSRGKLGHRETLSCFDKTRPIAASKRPGGHGPAKVCMGGSNTAFLWMDLFLGERSAGTVRYSTTHLLTGLALRCWLCAFPEAGSGERPALQ